MATQPLASRTPSLYSLQGFSEPLQGSHKAQLAERRSNFLLPACLPARPRRRERGPAGRDRSAVRGWGRHGAPGRLLGERGLGGGRDRRRPRLTLLSMSSFSFFCEMLFWILLLKDALPAGRTQRSPSSMRQQLWP